MFFSHFKPVYFQKCSYCSFENPESDAKFCIICGKELYHIQKQKINFIYDKNPALLVSFLAKIAKADNKIISKSQSIFLSSLLDKINTFYAKDYEGFREVYAKIFEIEKNGGRSIEQLCLLWNRQLSSLLQLRKKEEIDFFLYVLFDLAYFDGYMSESEDVLLERIVIGLG